MNIFTTENVAKYNTKSRTAGIGGYVLRNGVWAMDIRPEPFYQNYGTGDSRLLSEEFLPNTQYIIDLWIDADDCKYNGDYLAGGLRLYYTDSTYNNSATITGADNKGFQHIQYATDPTKSVQKFVVYYSTNTPIYYRADSFVTPLANITNVTKQGIITSGEFNEQITTPSDFSAKFGKGYIEVNEFIEY